MAKLISATGRIHHMKAGESTDNQRLKRPAILVHSGPNGRAMTFMSSDGEIRFDGARIKRIVDKQNLKILGLAAGYGGLEATPLGALTPVLDQHSDASSHGVGGRISSLLRFEVRDVPGVGPKCACAVADLTFLGQNVVERVKDGRIYHLSIGIDENTDTLSEVSTVIEPAAPGAMILAKHKNTGVKMPDIKTLKARSEARITKLKALKGDLDGLKTKLSDASTQLVTATNENAVVKRLAKALEAGKITPAEYKKMDVKRLAKLDKESLDVALQPIEALEPKVLLGQRGSTESTDVSTLGKGIEEERLKRLKAETEGDVKKRGVKLKAEDKVTKRLFADAGKEEEKKPADMAKLEEQPVAAQPQLAAPSEEQMSALDMMQKQVDELTTNLARIAGMVDELMNVEQEEGHDLAEGEEQPEVEPDSKEAPPAPEKEMEKGEEVPAEDKPAPEGEKEMSAEEKAEGEKKMKEEVKEQAQA